MKMTANDPVHELKAVLAEPLPWPGARIGFLAQFLLALFKVRRVHLAELATGLGGTAQVNSHYKRLPRFFRSFEMDPDCWARLLVPLVPVGDDPGRLTLDRTHWKFGRVDIHFLGLGIAYRGIALPVFWSVLGKAGHSKTAERIALMERFLAVFGVERIAVLLADRDCVGEAWFRWLPARPIPFHQRLKGDTLVPTPWNRMTRVDAWLGSLKPRQTHRLPGRRPVWGGFVHLSALRLDDGEWLMLAPSGAPPDEAIDAYADRWQLETRFGGLKTRGFHFEDTPLNDAGRLSQMRGLLALAWAWTHRIGEPLHEGDRPIPLKKPFSDRSSPSSATASISCVTSPSTSPRNSRISCGL
jgi:hypothetical protein